MDLTVDRAEEEEAQLPKTTENEGEAGDAATVPKESEEDDYGRQTIEVDGVKITQFGKVRVMESAAEKDWKKKVPKTTANPDEELSEDEMDEELPPALRFISPEDVVDISDASMTYFQWIGTQGQKVTVIRNVEHLVNLDSFCLRSNFVREMSGLATLTNLVSLELYENRLNTLEGVQNLVNLTNLDLSYNRLREIDPKWLRPLTKLKKLHIAQNKLSKIQGLETLVDLEILDLGMNRIKVMEGLDTLVNLEELWLGKNKFETIEGIESLKKLKRLSVQSNRLRHIGDGLKGLESLEELYLSHQGIEEFQGLDTLRNLNTLDVSNNQISSMVGLSGEKLPKLEELWMSYNNISSFEEMEKLSSLGGTLQTIYLDHNPIARDFEYRMRLMKTLPNLVQIDAVMFR